MFDEYRQKLQGLLGAMPLVQILRGEAPVSREGLFGALKGIKPFQAPSEEEAMNYMNAVTPVGLLGSVANGMTKFENAHKVAQKNAEKMLGLPPNNTAMDRAKALMFDADSFHATPYDWNVPDMSKSVRQAFGAGLHSADSPELANMFARQADNSQVMPLKIRKGKVADASTFRNYAEKLGYGDINKVTDALKSDGFDTVVYSHGRFYWPENGRLIESNPMQDLAYASLKPQNIRSRFAAFDPARIDEADLLAGYFGIPLYGHEDRKGILQP